MVIFLESIRRIIRTVQPIRRDSHTERRSVEYPSGFGLRKSAHALVLTGNTEGDLRAPNAGLHFLADSVKVVGQKWAPEAENLE